MGEVVRYNFRLRPGKAAERALMAEWHRCRFLWNEAVHQQRVGRKPTRTKLGKLLTAARAANAWLRAGSQNAQSGVLNTYAVSLEQSFKVKDRGKPGLKKRSKAQPSLEYSRNGFRIVDTRLQLAKGITVPVVWSRELPSDPTSVRVYLDSLGHWYASFVVRRDVGHHSTANGRIGIDWGVATTATATDPVHDLPYGGHRRRCAGELAKQQRRLSRRRRPRGTAPSKGYRRTRRDVAKLHKKAARQNAHCARVWAKQVVAENQLIAIEDFKPKFLATSTMARRAADAAIGVAKRELIERAERAGRTVVIVVPAYTTMTCHRCFARTTQRLGLAERTFSCRSCGLICGRDLNAARTILAVAERGHTSVDDVRRDSAPPSGDAVSVRSELEISRLEA
ncbi:RNA-guided endonuclease InsQ/TnpB family protein [Nocardia sp. NPDC058176]|uniref:RNA-guided endonuclease InsQ/TnpB family protein n=1 Tax=Nocardia sp. NPDC058176 TaxID=3346368 RepID=UPI0036D7B8D9